MRSQKAILILSPALISLSYSLSASAIVGGACDKYTDNEIRQIMIDRSKAMYRGHCPCPDDMDEDGVRCGQNSLFHKQRGGEPYCFLGDISKGMVTNFRFYNKCP